MLAEFNLRPLLAFPAIRRPVHWILTVTVVVLAGVMGCAANRTDSPSAMQAVSNDGTRPFGGAPAIDIPPSAYAMGAYLQAEVASDNGDRARALKEYEDAVHYDPDSAALHIKLATLYLGDGRLREALDQANAAVALDPNYAHARLLAAGLSTALGDDATAEKQYQEVIKLSPSNQEAYLFLGTLYAKEGHYDKARVIFSRLIAIDPGSFLGYYYAGRVSVSAKDYAQADRDYHKALELNPQSELALLDLAMLRELENRPKDAIDLYEEILQVNPNDDLVRKRLAELRAGGPHPSQTLAELQREEQSETSPADARTKIGLLFFERGDFDRAATEFNLVLGSAPNDYRVRYYLGSVYIELDEDSKAIDQFQKIPVGDEHYVESRLQLAYLFDKQHDYDKAIAQLNDALHEKPDDQQIMGFMVGVYEEQKNYQKAIELARKMVSMDPQNDKFHFTLGALYDESKQKQLGVEEMRKAITINPSNAPALNYLGYTYAESGSNLDEAEKLIKRALIIEPEDGFYVDSLGWVYYQKGEYGKAVTALERAVNLTGDDPTITEHLGDAYAKVGKFRDARHEYEDALKKAEDETQSQRLRNKIAALPNGEQHASH